MPVGIFGGTDVLVETRSGGYFLPLKGPTQWTTSGGETTSEPVPHLRTKDGILNLPGTPSTFTIDINDATAVLSHITWKTLRDAFGDPRNNIPKKPVKIALLTDGTHEENYTVPAEIGATVAVAGSDYTSATGKYHGMGLVTVAGTAVGDNTKQITRLDDASIEDGKQFEIGGRVYSIAEIVSDTDALKTFRVTDPSGAAVAAVGTPTGFKVGQPVECYGLSTRSAPSGFSCLVNNPGSPGRVVGGRRTVNAQLAPVANRFPDPTLIPFT